MDTSQQLRKAYETAKAGDRTGARQVVKEILKVEPNNDAAWYLYARIAENRQKSIYCLEKALEINPSHARALQDLERFKSASSVSATSQEHNLPAHTSQRTTNKQRSMKMPVWILVILAGFASVVAIACIGYFVFAGTLLPSAQPSSPATARPLVFSTPTSDCTCSRATGYLEQTFSRVDTISTQILSIESAYEDGSMLELNFTAFSSEAKIIYKEQLGETPPACLQSFQNKTVSLLWNWQQTMEYVAGGQYGAADLFIQGFVDDFTALESEGERLLQEELNGCIMDPDSGPNL
jgi:tetratricopeptide (TPR) repeat protein